MSAAFDHGDLLDRAADQAAEHDAQTNPYDQPTTDWVCANGHTNGANWQRCWADCEGTVYDDDPDYSDDEVRRG